MAILVEPEERLGCFDQVSQFTTPLNFPVWFKAFVNETDDEVEPCQRYSVSDQIHEFETRSSRQRSN